MNIFEFTIYLSNKNTNKSYFHDERREQCLIASNIDYSNYIDLYIT